MSHYSQQRVENTLLRKRHLIALTSIGPMVAIDCGGTVSLPFRRLFDPGALYLIVELYPIFILYGKVTNWLELLQLSSKVKRLHL
ncbi:MAG: hypothetical protein SXA11_11095 [Cyanobacteriota bacterium]|nr:hypothetical protein [Cyanobacteriota bacterium]